MKDHLYDELRELREAVVGKLDGLAEYDVRRPLTTTGTNLLGLVKHLALWEARYLGEVFDRPFPEPLPRGDDAQARGADLWVTEHETRAEIVDRYRRVWSHSDATVAALPVDAPGHVPWWPRPRVTLLSVLVHLVTETGRHAGHADILREQLDTVDASRDRRATIELAAKIAVAEPAYRRWLASRPDDLLLDSGVLLYSRGSLAERNATFEVADYAPGHLLIGDDSGGGGFLIRARDSVTGDAGSTGGAGSTDDAGSTGGGPVFRVGLGSLREDDFEEVAGSFEAWESMGFTAPD